LVAATVAGNSVSYSYDAFDVRVGATVNGVSSNYLWDREATYPLLVDDGNHAYLHNNGPLAQIDSGGNRTYLLTDALHSVRGLVDGSGALVGTTDYAAFGALRSQIGMTSSMGFTGELFSAATGLLHLRARDLMPALGRFLSVDTVQPNAPGTMGYNLYAYAANNPTTWVDPSGHFREGPPTAPDPVVTREALKILLGSILAFCSGSGLVCLFIAIFLAIVLVLWLMDLYRNRIPVPIDGPVTQPDGGPGQAPPTPSPTPDDSNLPVFYPGNDYPLASLHISDAINAGFDDILTKGPEQARGWWLENYTYQPKWQSKQYNIGGNPCAYPGYAQKGKYDCDEYPFNDVLEGGKGGEPSLRVIPYDQNRGIGGKKRWFYKYCKVAIGDRYKVEVDMTRPTDNSSCGRR
jgi:RHS repeat-associated protein